MGRYRYTVKRGGIPHRRYPDVNLGEPQSRGDSRHDPGTWSHAVPRNTTDHTGRPRETRSRSRATSSQVSRLISTPSSQSGKANRIREILHAGIRAGFQKEQEFLASGNLATSEVRGSEQFRNGNMATVAGMQKVCDRLAGMHLDRETDHVYAQYMVGGLPTNETDDSMEELGEAQGLRSARQSESVQWATKRLQHVSRLGNDMPDMTGSMRINTNNPRSILPAYCSTKVREFLKRARHQRGCRRLLVSSITFKKITQANQANQLNSIDSEAEVIMTVENYNRKGFIAVYETDMMAPPTTGSSDRSGLSSTIQQPGILVHIIKPLWMYKRSGTPIAEPPSEPPSELVIFIPRSQVVKTEEVWVPSPPDPSNCAGHETLSIRASLLCSRDGVPSFVWTEKENELWWLGCTDEFLTLGTFLEYIDYDPENGVSSKFEERYQEDYLRWKQVQEAMASSACIVEIQSEPGEGWDPMAPRDASTRERGQNRFPLKYGACMEGRGQ